MDGGEIYSWPGAEAFEEHDPTDVVTGSITSGEYSSIMAAVFDSDVVSCKSGEDEMLAGRRIVRYDYTVKEPRYRLRCARAQVDLPYHGSFWVDPESERLLALQVRLDGIPDMMDVYDVTNLIEYAPVQLGTEVSSFPSVAEIAAKFRRGTQEIRNRIEFSRCRRYTGQSKITFGESPSPEATPKTSEPDDTPSVPGGVTFELALDKAITIAAVAGDPVEATLRHAVRARGIQIPQGARFSGRVLRCEVVYRPVPYGQITFEFFDVSFGGTRLNFRGRLQSFDRLAGLRDDWLGQMPLRPANWAI